MLRHAGGGDLGCRVWQVVRGMQLTLLWFVEIVALLPAVPSVCSVFIVSDALSSVSFVILTT